MCLYNGNTISPHTEVNLHNSLFIHSALKFLRVENRKELKVGNGTRMALNEYWGAMCISIVCSADGAS